MMRMRLLDGWYLVGSLQHGIYSGLKLYVPQSRFPSPLSTPYQNPIQKRARRISQLCGYALITGTVRQGHSPPSLHDLYPTSL